MLDIIRNLIIILSAILAFIISVIKVFYNMPIILIRESNKFLLKEENILGSAINLLGFFSWSLSFLSVILLFLYKVFIGNNSPNKYIFLNDEYLNKYSSVLLIFFFIIIILVTCDGVFTLRLYVKNLGIKKWKHTLISVISIIICSFALLYTLVNLSYSKKELTLNINGEKILFYATKDIDLNKDSFDIYLNGLNILNYQQSEDKSGQAILIFNDKNIKYNISSKIQLKSDDEIKIISNDKYVSTEYYKSILGKKEYIYLVIFLIVYFAGFSIISGNVSFRSKLNNMRRNVVFYGDDSIIADFIIEIDDYYLVKNDKRELLISKKEIKEIRKPGDYVYKSNY